MVIASEEKLSAINIESTPMLTNMVEHIILRISDLVHFSGQRAFKYQGVQTASTNRHIPNAIHNATKISSRKPYIVIISYI
jgi:hypothetical protein